MELPINLNFPAVGSIGLAIVGFINLIKDTLFGEFIRWLHLGFFMDFVIMFFVPLSILFFVIIFLQWTKNLYVLLVLALLFFLFLKFGLKSIGGISQALLPLLIINAQIYRPLSPTH